MVDLFFLHEKQGFEVMGARGFCTFQLLIP